MTAILYAKSSSGSSAGQSLSVGIWMLINFKQTELNRTQTTGTSVISSCHSFSLSVLLRAEFHEEQEEVSVVSSFPSFFLFVSSLFSHFVFLFVLFFFLINKLEEFGGWLPYVQDNTKTKIPTPELDVSRKVKKMTTKQNEIEKQ